MSLLDKLKKFEQTPKAPTPVTKKPPMAPKKSKEMKEKLSKPQKKSLDEKIGFEIDWVKVAQSSDFKRAVYLAIEGKSFRGTNDKLEKELNKKIEVIRDPNFYGAVKQMKTMFKNGFIKPSDIIKEQVKVKNKEIVENESNNTVVNI